MRNFELKEWLDNRDLEVVTRTGRPVRIVCWDNSATMPVIAVGPGGNPWTTTKEGRYRLNGEESAFDIFFADDKPGRFTEFERMFIECCCHTEPEYLSEGHLKNRLESAKKLYEIAKREIDTGFEPKFTYSEKDYSELGNKLIEFRNNTPLCSTVYRENEGRMVITHYEKEITEIVRRQLEAEKRTEEDEPNGVPVSVPAPKFKPGEWIAASGTDVNEDYRVVRIVKADGGNYTIESPKGFLGCNSFDAWESGYRPWTIDDAREGDILVSEQGSLFVYTGRKSDEGGKPFAYCGVIDNAFVECPPTVPCTDWKTAPATYEQRIEMESKMREAGYGWDITFTKPMRVLQEELKATYVPQWTEKDEACYSRISECIEQDTDTSAEEHTLLEWLKLRTAVPAAREFGTEDLLNLDQAIYVCHQNGYDAVEDWLKALKGSRTIEGAKKAGDILGQQGGWTKEDEELSEKIYDCADFLLLKDSGVPEDRFIEWFDSLKRRLQGSRMPEERGPHNPNENIRYDMCFSDAQRYLSDRGFDVPWNDCDVFVDGRYITQSVANILAWADDHREEGWKPTDRDIKDLEWCAELFKEKMGVGYHRLQVLIDNLKTLAENE